MKDKFRPILIEAIWLITTALLSIFLAKILFGWTDFKENIDISLNDTHFVYSSWDILILLFLFVTFVVYFIKENNQSFNRKVPTLITIISGIALVCVLTILIKLTSNFTVGGWTAYPPLNAIPQITENKDNELMCNSLTAIQLTILLMLLYTSYCYGKRKGGDI
jgi:hypothetical protein